MNKNRFLIVLMLISIWLVTLSCGLFSGDEEASVPSESSAESSMPEADTSEGGDSAASAASPDEPDSPSMEVALGDEYRSAEGGYAFQPIPDYKLEEFFGLTTMLAPDGDPDLGPLLMLIGGTNEDPTTNEDIYNDFVGDVEDEDVELLDRKDIMVDGHPGILSDLRGEADGQPVYGRIVVVAVTETQQFTMFATSPQAAWDDFQALFDAVLDSVYFFEPEEIDLSEDLNLEMGEEAEEGDLTESPPDEEFPAYDTFPTDASELAPGGFAYLLAGTEGLPVMVVEGNLQDQSTSAEYVLGLVSEDQSNVLTLFIPMDVATGILTMTYYDEAAATQGPGAAVYKSATLYTNTDGIIMIDDVSNNTITGSVFFTAVDEAGNELAITGFFRELPLP